MMLPSAQCETLRGCAGAAGGGGGGATSTELPIESKTPRLAVPVPLSTPRWLASGADATGCSLRFAMVFGIVVVFICCALLMFEECVGCCPLGGGAGGAGGVGTCNRQNH